MPSGGWFLLSEILLLIRKWTYCFCDEHELMLANTFKEYPTSSQKKQERTVRPRPA